MTFLHPSILSKKSALIFSNHFTTAFLDAKVYEKKTVLFTDFSEKVLKSTGYKAPREEIVDVFISGNEKLRLMNFFGKKRKMVHRLANPLFIMV